MKGFLSFKNLRILFLFITIVGPILLFSVYPWGGGDDLHYLLLAKSIVHRHRYLDIYLPTEPPNTQYPPGWPLLLSPLALVFNDPYFPAKVLTLLISILTVFIGFKFFGKFKDRWLGLFAFGLVFIPVSYWQYSSASLSDIPFLFVVLLYFLVVDNKGKGGPVKLLPLFLPIIAFYIRTVGISLYLGHLLYLTLKKRRRRAVQALYIGMPIIMLWPLRNLLVAHTLGSSSGYLSSFFLKNPTLPEVGRASLSDILIRPIHNVSIFVTKALPNYFIQFSFAKMRGLWGIILTLLFLLGLLRLKTLKDIHPFLPFVVLYLPMYLMWPEPWNEHRLLLPIMPFIAVLLVEGGRVMLKPFKKVRNLIPAILVGIIFTVNIFNVGGAIIPLWKSVYIYLKKDYLNLPNKWWAESFEVFQWMKENVPEDAIVLTRKPRVFAYFTDRHCTYYPRTRKQRKIWKFLKDHSDKDIFIVYVNWLKTDYGILRPFLTNKNNRRYIPTVYVSKNKHIGVFYVWGFPEDIP